MHIDKTPPVCVVEYSTQTLTNDDVIVYIKSNEEIQEIEGFTLIENNTVAYRILEENEYLEIVEIKDLAGNRTKIIYNVDWIDKESPKIIGVENNEIVNEYLNLEYTDNVEIASIVKNKIGDLKIYINYFYENIISNYKRGFYQDNITVTIREMPQGAEEFSYYINGELKATTKEKSYTFENLNEGEIYEFYAETTKDGKTYESDKREQRTAIFEEITLSESEESIDLKMENILEDVDMIRLSVWSEENSQDDLIHYYIEDINHKSLEYKINIANHNNLKDIYSVHVYLFDKDGNELGMYPGRYEFIEARDSEEYEFDKDGTYEVIVKDTAKNETTKIFTIDTISPVVDIEYIKENNKCTIKNINIEDESKIVKVEYIVNGEIIETIEKEEILNTDISGYIFENINDSNLSIKIYDEAGNYQIANLQ